MFSSTFKKSLIGEFFIKSLNSKQTTILCLFLALLNKISIAWLYLSLEGDKSLYLLFSQSLLNGKALLEPVSFIHSSNIEYIYNPAITSPLYSIISAPLLYLTDSYVATSIIIDFIAWASFFSALYIIAKLILVERWIANIFILTAGFFLYPHELASTPKDTLSVGLILWSCYFTHKVIISPKLEMSLVALLCFTYTLFALTKFLYSPLIIIFLVILFINAVIKRSRHHFLHAFISIGIVLMSFISFSLFMTNLKQLSSSYVLNSDGTTFIKGIYPENLSYIFPFISSSFINTNFWGVQLERLSHISFTRFNQLFQLIDLLVIVIALFFLIFNNKRVKKLPLLFLIMCAIGTTIIFMVCYMSFTHKAQYSASGPGYTYVMESRSFLFVMVALQLLAFYFIFSSVNYLRFKLLLLSFFLFEGLHGVYFIIKQMVNLDAVLAHHKAESPNKKIIYKLYHLGMGGQVSSLVTTDNNLRRLALVNGLKAYSFNRGCSTRIKIKIPALIAIPERDSAILENCLSDKQSKVSDTIPPYILYWTGVKYNM
jgi:hypothetical protein